MGALLVVALAAPLLVGLAGWRLSGPTARDVLRWTALGAAGAWALFLVAGGVRAGDLGAAGPPGAAAAGVALLLASLRRPVGRLAVGLTGAAVTALSAGLALSAGGGAPVDAAGGLILAAVALAVVTRQEDDGGAWWSALALLGTAAIAWGTSGLDGGDLGAGPVEAMSAGPVVAGAAAVVLAAGWRPRRALVLLVPAALAAGVPMAALLPDGRTAAAVVLAVVATALAAVRPVAALGLWSLAAACVPGGTAAAWLLAGAAVLVGVALVPAALATALPGAAALLLVLAESVAARDVALGALAACTVGALVVAANRPRPTGAGPLPAVVAASGIGAWLLVLPGSWGWAGDVVVGPWGEGLAPAALVVLTLVGGAWALGIEPVPWPSLDAPDPPPGAPDGRWAAVGVGLSAGLTAIAAVALVASVGS